MKFHTKIDNGIQITEVILECHECENRMFREQELCTNCGSDNLDWLEIVTFKADSDE